MNNVVNLKIPGAEGAPGGSSDGKKTESVENYEKPLQQLMTHDVPRLCDSHANEHRF